MDEILADDNEGELAPLDGSLPIGLTLEGIAARAITCWSLPKLAGPVVKLEWSRGTQDNHVSSKPQ